MPILVAFRAIAAAVYLHFQVPVHTITSAPQRSCRGQRACQWFKLFIRRPKVIQRWYQEYVETLVYIKFCHAHLQTPIGVSKLRFVWIVKALLTAVLISAFLFFPWASPFDSDTSISALRPVILFFFLAVLAFLPHCIIPMVMPVVVRQSWEKVWKGANFFVLYYLENHRSLSFAFYLFYAYSVALKPSLSNRR